MENSTNVATFSASNRPASDVKLTPLMQQYWDIKSAHEDKIVLFRMGDFFEMFHRDAETAAPVLGIALTARNKKSADETPMCGVPHHSIANSINKLLLQGFKVAICDQIEDPKFAKGLVKRAVTRILSPGVVYDPDTLDAVAPNYLASTDEQHVSFLDATTGEAFFFKVAPGPRRERLIASLQPVEIVSASSGASDASNTVGAAPVATSDGPVLSTHDALFDGGELTKAWPESARRLIAYAVHMQGAKVLETLSPFEKRELLDRMDLPPSAIRHLEIFETYRGDRGEGTLYHAINRCKTSAGARLLRQWLQFPLASHDALESRLSEVERWTNSSEELKEMRRVLGGLGDVQRRLAKLGNPNCYPRDLKALAESLRAGLEACSIARNLKWDTALCESAARVAGEIERLIEDEPPAFLKNGGVIRKGVRKELDELIELSTNSQSLILELEAREREATGIPSLKVRFNNVFGYYIEITNTHKDKVPTDRYDRKQTLANAERYLTKELAELESKVLSAQSKRIELETEIFQKLIEQTLKEAQKLLKLANIWAELDVITSFAWLAIEQNYTRPRFTTTNTGGARLKLKANRHPVIEQALKLPFVANDIELPRNGCLLLTGPNMAGKSTLMRQVACAALMAQIGSFVPAQDAELPLFDRIFTRIGASDFLSEGLSTFMVEMKETAEMLESATEDSLVILDEVGRGTSTYDGMSLAQSILEFLLETKKSMTLFATHYHELTELAQKFPQLFNAHMRIHEKNGAKGPEITFLHQLSEGPANKSYGIHVAKLAGLPGSVTKRAGAILKKLESSRMTVDLRQMSLLGLMDESAPDHNVEEQPQIDPAVRAAMDELKSELEAIDLSRLTPLDALNQIAKWQRSLS